MVTVTDLLDRLKGVKPTAQGHLARCPAHDDSTASLAISTGADGRILLHCHAGCTVEHVCAALNIKPADLFPQRNGSERRIVATYDYVDAHGKVLFQVVRFEPKDFRQRRPDPSSIDSWSWSTKGTTKVLYHLPDVTAAVKRGDTVFIVEGEKDVESLKKLGLVGTCNPGGAGKWQDSFSEALRGANVVLLPDADEPGRKHAELVASKLQGIARAVKVATLNKGKDAHDFFAMGGTVDELAAIVRDTPFTTAEAPDDPYAPIEWDDLLKPVDYSENLLGNRLLERGQGFLIFGPAGCGKSVAAAQALAEWAAGLDGLHIQPPRPLRIVVLQTEDSINDHRENFDGIFNSSVFTPEARSLIRQNLIILKQAPGGNAGDLAKHLNAIGERHKPDLVSVNPLLAFVSGDPTRELGGLLYQTIDPIIKHWGFGFLGIHHTPKTNNRDTSNYGAHDWQYAAAGDARVANWPRAMISIEPVANGVYRFRAAKRWNRTGWTWDLKPTSERYFKWAQNCVRWVDAMPEEVQRAEAIEDYRQILDVIPAADKPGITRARVRELAKSKLKVNGKGIGKDKADAWLKLCIEDGEVSRTETTNGANRKEALFNRKEDSK